MLEDKTFQIGFIVCQVLCILLIGVVSIPFAIDMFEDWSKLPQFPIWVIQIFFAILTIIFIVVTYKLMKLENNKFKVFNVILTLGITLTFIFELSYCFIRMGA